jgi:hypothetical protein
MLEHLSRLRTTRPRSLFATTGRNRFSSQSEMRQTQNSFTSPDARNCKSSTMRL